MVTQSGGQEVDHVSKEVVGWIRMCMGNWPKVPFVRVIPNVRFPGPLWPRTELSSRLGPWRDGNLLVSLRSAVGLWLLWSSVVRLRVCDLILSGKSVVGLRVCNSVSPGWSMGRLWHLWDFDHVFSLKSGLRNNRWDRGYSRGLSKCCGQWWL